MKSQIVTNMVKRLLRDQEVSKIELAELLGISRPTLDARLQKGNWKKGEIMLLENYLK